MALLQTLKRRSDFLKATQSSLKWITPSFIVQVIPASEAPASDICFVGFTVTKKVDLRSVVRNRIRRRLREAARGVLAVQGLAGQSYIFVARKDAVDYPFEKLKQDMAWAFEKLKSGVVSSTPRPRENQKPEKRRS